MLRAGSIELSSIDERTTRTQTKDLKLSLDVCCIVFFFAFLFSFCFAVSKIFIAAVKLYDTDDRVEGLPPSEIEANYDCVPDPADTTINNYDAVPPPAELENYDCVPPERELSALRSSTYAVPLARDESQPKF